jgi:hypothetical protein
MLTMGLAMSKRLTVDFGCLLENIGSSLDGGVSVAGPRLSLKVPRRGSVRDLEY